MYIFAYIFGALLVYWAAEIYTYIYINVCYIFCALLLSLGVRAFLTEVSIKLEFVLIIVYIYIYIYIHKWFTSVVQGVQSVFDRSIHELGVVLIYIYIYFLYCALLFYWWVTDF